MLHQFANACSIMPGQAVRILFLCFLCLFAATSLIDMSIKILANPDACKRIELAENDK